MKFAETKPLPSYLVAYAVGNLEFVDAGTAGKKDTRIRIVVPHGHSAEAQYAAQTTPAIVNLLESYFGIPYPYDKLDEVAIPLAGYAMEHPGLVTYGSAIIIEKPDQDTLAAPARMGERGVTRTRPPVGWRPRHHSLVGRYLAERRVCLLDGQQECE